MKLARVQEMRDMDRRAGSEFGLSEDLLMENAGQAVYVVALQELGIRGKQFAVVCGGGNNGGDGLVVARKIHSSGGDAKVLLLEDEGRFTGAARKNFEILSRMPVEISRVESADSAARAILTSDGVVDAMFGTGLVREVDGVFRDIIQLINTGPGIVFSVDIPSGVNGDTGEVMGLAVQADHTVTFGLPKIGNMLYPGYAHCGELYVSHISFPPELYDSDDIKLALNTPVELPERAGDTHKGTCGKALFIAGSTGYLGAPYFSAMSFLKAGGGLSYLAAPKSISSFLANKGSEIIVLPQRETASGCLALENKAQIVEFARGMDMVAIGPGLSLDTEAQELVRELVGEIDRPLLIDGDGITAIARATEKIRGRKAPTILTPHPGEMTRITDTELEDISRNRVDIVQRTARELGAVVVLKGAHSLIGYPNEKVFVNVSGNPGMATAGSGDVLTGTIAGMYGLGLSLEDAVRVAVFIQGFAGDIAAADKGEDGITAQDVMDYLPEAMKLYRENFPDISENTYESIFVV